MKFSQFLSENDLADEVAEYEIWRLAFGLTQDPVSLVEQVAFRAGQPGLQNCLHKLRH